VNVRHSGKEKNGSASGAKARTSWDLTFTVGIPFSRWGARPFVLSPIPFPAGIVEETAHGKTERCVGVPPRPHPFELAPRWRQELEDNPTLSRAKIAVGEGLSRGQDRVADLGSLG
jgi:hypothetical protein